MVTQHGYEQILKALAGPLSALGMRFWRQNSRVDRVFPLDPGYPKTGDHGLDNPDGGDWVLTFRVTIPKGAIPGGAVFDEVELVQPGDGGIWFRQPLPRPLRAGLDYPSVQYINMFFQR